MAPLDQISTAHLREILPEVDGKKATIRIMIAITWKENSDSTQEEIAERYGYSQGWLSQWLHRLERLEEESFEDVVYDQPRSGRPATLSEAERERFIDALTDAPSAVGFDMAGWSVPLAQTFLADEFDVQYSQRHVRRLLSEAGLQPVTTRTESASPAEPSGVREDDNSNVQRTVWVSEPEI